MLIGSYDAFRTSTGICRMWLAWMPACVPDSAA
jgi:hypothetical protein